MITNAHHTSDTEKDWYHQCRGFTVLEVIIAVFIFGCISAALVKTIMTADRIRGRSAFISDSVLLAQNEVERLRNAASFNTEALDCTYVATINQREYNVERRIITNENALIKTATIPEIELAIKPSVSDSGFVYYRFLQGFTW
ncbi:MAG TPA: prepilin-type N-terminal cleavage/methylation domain-containing protein [Chitinispirillaceae bacterium]|nr:prepilin-type N-terminal cleavage/methylation domain-containing protein [Chitinispirillaceae bacterium]